jgi:hypothetical protein
MCSLRLSRKEGIRALGACIETNVADEQLADTVHGPWSEILAPRFWSALSSLAWGPGTGTECLFLLRVCLMNTKITTKTHTSEGTERRFRQSHSVIE